MIDARPAQVYAALTDPDALVAWLPPAGMRGAFEHFDLRVGGSYRLVLTYDDAPSSGAKTTADADIVDARFVDVVPNEQVVHAVDFVSDDPAFAGTMTMTWSLEADGDRTRVDIIAADVPPGISADDHAAGMASSLENLAHHVESERA